MRIVEGSYTCNLKAIKFMLIVISPEEDVVDESVILNHLFDNGLVFFHLRKPSKSRAAHVSYLKRIRPEYHKHVMLHFYHDLMEEFGLMGCHFQEKERMRQGDKMKSLVEQYQKKGYSVSGSFHNPEDIVRCKSAFDYVLLSPVFNSISKSGYKGRGFSVNHIAIRTIGMGGIQQNTIEAASALGYAGVGVLGGIWYAEDPLTAFCEIDNCVKEVFV